MPDDDLRPATRQDLLTALSYGLRFRRGKATGRFNELAAQFAAEALADLLLESNLVIMKKPPAQPIDVRRGMTRLTE